MFEEMKKMKFLLGFNLFVRILCVFVSFVFASSASAQEVYAVLSGDKTILTFYYDDSKEVREGTVYTEDNISGSPNRNGWYTDRDNITYAVFDSSLANYEGFTNTSYWFYNCKNLKSIKGLEYLKTGNVQTMDCMFSGCSSLTEIDLSHLNTQKVNRFMSMFYGCNHLTHIDVSNFDTSEAVYFQGMFSYCSALTSIDVSSFNTVKAKSMSSMFYCCAGLKKIDLTSFQTDNLVDVDGMFEDCHNLNVCDLSSFNTCKITNMQSVFYNCRNLKTIYVGDLWSTSNVIYGRYMFKNCTSLVGGDGTNVGSDITCSKAYAGSGGYMTLKGQDVEGISEAYAVLSENNTKLTFFYDSNKSSNRGIEVDVFESATDVGWHSYSSNIETVLFDESFKNCTDITSTAYWFSGCTNLSSVVNINFMNTTNLVDMRAMFSGCSSLTEIDLSGFDTPNVVVMDELFKDCSSMKTVYVSDTWSVKNVMSGADAFLNCTSIIGGKGTIYSPIYTDYTYANMDGGETMPGYFSDTKLTWVPYALLSNDNKTLTFYFGPKEESLQGMSVGPFTNIEQRGWHEHRMDITKVVFDKSFADCTNLTSTMGWFSGCGRLTVFTDLANLKTENVTDMSQMFEYLKGFTYLDLSSFDTRNVQNMSRMFSGSSKLRSVVVKNFDTSNVTDMSSLFSNCENLYLTDLSNFDTRKVINMAGMFFCCRSITSLDLSNFDTSNVTDMGGMFASCENMKSLNISSFNTSKVTSMSNMFPYLLVISNLDLSNFDTSNVTDMSHMFCYSNIKTLDLSNFDTSNVTDMKGMFYYCSYLKELNISSFNTANVTDMLGMFAGCTSLCNLDISHFDTRKVTNMERMFANSTAFTTLDLTSFATAEVTNMSGMFSSCTSLKTIYVTDKWSTDKVTESNEMFSNTYNVVGGKGTTFDSSHSDVAYARIDKGVSFPGYLTESSCDSDGDIFIYHTAEGIIMTFRVVSVADKTCEVYGLSTGPAINSGTSGIVTIPTEVNGFTVRIISSYAFFGCNRLIIVIIPSTITSIGDHAFEGCYSLKEVHSLIENPFVLQTSVFAGVPATATLYIPAGTKTEFEVTEGWKRFTIIVEVEQNRGDLNGDKSVDVTDVVELIDMVLAGIYDSVGDINGDGDVDVTDVVELIDMVLSGE